MGTCRTPLVILSPDRFASPSDGSSRVRCEPVWGSSFSNLLEGPPASRLTDLTTLRSLLACPDVSTTMDVLSHGKSPFPVFSLFRTLTYSLAHAVGAAYVREINFGYFPCVRKPGNSLTTCLTQVHLFYRGRFSWKVV